ncbi:MAG TPA: hypothetical protein PLA11_11100 [Flavobacteriales bacterium]|nr:hypothetical protein [Flavobacteriales bacterium]MCB0786219.1 hypothetical protein [Flavobacteriales bacterium]MCB0788555.1 hypothetical protein [Flavobacteriales bacterium]MCB0809527.1 hypothetical protein [Flavobacteriales bacterium]MCB0813572.1 hypothetical protein [Flavobacteriales bacterium]
MFRINLLLLGVGMAWQLPAQFKYEHEERMAAEAVPGTARAVVEMLELQGRVRWYREQGYDRTSIEAKVRHRGKRYSIEFDAGGRLEDVEVEVSQRTVPVVVWKRISALLTDSLGRYRVQKLQERYTGRPEAVKRHLHGQHSEDVLAGYELMVSAREEGAYVLFEYEFTADGAFVRRDRVVLHHADHIMY